ncbi:DUF4381 domain-containing protein [Achromobacter mucicolens]|uniref:DUF4381 domain-containing protein n=1 Tax=Achromobacter mucicolens TaxID=1389922 RepID=UPI001CBAB3EA|nr:DUF4381 domain-containing protein [Achromobacter mucicolens]UAN03636.1 DUF4381 domain-containing protein [Achromobacter mucicolens]
MNEELPGLDQLRELPLPAPVSYWPQTWGWLVVTVVVALAAGWLAARAWRRWRRNRYRREALSELRQLEADMGADPLAARALPSLLKRTALAAQGPGGRAAALSGETWVAWLASSGATLPGNGAHLLETLAYASNARVSALEPSDVRQLLVASRHWMERHHVAA